MSLQLQIMLQQAVKAFREGSFDSAYSISKRLLEIDKKNFTALYIFGLINALRGSFEDAIFFLGQAVKINPNDAPLQYNLAKALSDCGKDEEAIAHHIKATTLDPSNLDAWMNYGKSFGNIGQFEDALICYDKVLSLKPDYAEAWSNKGVMHHELKQYQNALSNYDKALSLKPDYAEAWSNKGAALNELKRYEEALDHYDKALSLKPDYAEAWSNKGTALNELKRYEEALDYYDKALSLKPDYAEAWANKGVALNELKRYEEALDHYDKALSLKPDYAEAWSNKGTALNELKRYEEALDHYDKALSLKPDYAEAWANKGMTLFKIKRYEEALVYSDKALSLDSDCARAWANKGVTLQELRYFEDALACHDKVLSLKPDHAEAWANKAGTLNELHRYEEAINYHDKALSLKPDYAEAWANKAGALNELKRYEEALTHYEKALSLNPDIERIFGDLVYCGLKMASWTSFKDYVCKLRNDLLVRKKIASPFVTLSLIDDAYLHKNCAEIYALDRHPFNDVLGFSFRYPASKKIRIGYFSADFKNHPVSVLTAELFELHDRDKFEIIAFSFGVDDKSPIRLRLSKAFDQFIDVSKMSDLEIAKLSRDLRIDIAVDLAGHTANNRMGIFSYRVAPVQVNWLGYPGTIGVDYFDYILADKIVIPTESQKFYSEKVVYLPHTYMVDDTKRIVSSRVFTRKECGLPENAFIFCCFNNHHKFNPHVLDGWARILLAVKNSVIWLSENNKSFTANIVKEFKERGIDSKRVFFAKKLNLMEDYLARYNLADLFLDTYPYNAHTTAIDSLKGGVPLVTLMGQSFASRVAASLLNAIDLPMLATSTQEEYESLAIRLATNPQSLLDIKLKLIDNRLTKPLFNTSLFVKGIEMSYIKMHQRYQAGLLPAHMIIS